MKDRFKFRVWDGVENEYIEYIDIFRINKDGELVVNDSQNNKEIIVNHKRLVVEQCTGLKDRNGNLIYEGDIVDTFYKGLPTGQRYIYRYKPPAFYVEPFEKGKPSGSHWYYFSVNEENCLVVGNIHENPELLEESDE